MFIVLFGVSYMLALIGSVMLISYDLRNNQDTLLTAWPVCARVRVWLS